MLNETVYNIIVIHGDSENEYVVSSLKLAKRAYAHEFSRLMETGDAFSIDLYTGRLDEFSLFDCAECIATFTYDGDASVWEAE